MVAVSDQLMSLHPGTHVGFYAVTAKLGEGGVGDGLPREGDRA